MKKIIFSAIFMLVLTTTAQAANLFTYTGTVAQGALIRDALCSNYNYQAKIEQSERVFIDNPESCAQFARRMLTEFVMENVKAYKAKDIEATRKQLLDDATTQTIGITVN